MEGLRIAQHLFGRNHQTLELGHRQVSCLFAPIGELLD